MDKLITSLDQVTPNWLTRVLEEKETLPKGKVIKIQQKSSSPFSAIISRLEAIYSDDVPKSTPTKFILKISNPDNQAEIPEQGKREIEFYKAITGVPQSFPVPTCYDAYYSDEKEMFHVLLEDLSSTHFELTPPLPPFKLQCEQVIDTVAQIHAYWWNHPRLGRDIGKLPTEESEGDIVLEKKFPDFIDFLGDRFSSERRKIYENVISVWPKLTRRFTEGKNLTLCHGDTHFWNFLYPHNPDLDTVHLIDWETVGINIGSDDLAYMIALFWYPEHRVRLEQHLLRRYHRQLLAHGVQAYDWHDFWYDYRLSVIRKLFEPVWWWSTKHPPFIWWDRLERVILAFQDLDCAELLET